MIQCVYEDLKMVVNKNVGDDISASYIKLNIDDKHSTLTVDAGCLYCESNDQRLWAGCRATHGVRGGCYGYECVITKNGIARVGWSTKTANLELGKDSFGFGYGGTGKKSNNNKYDDYGEPFGLNDVIGCYVNYELGVISYTKNGKPLGIAFALPANIRDVALFPSILLKDSAAQVAFHSKDFRCTILKGYQDLASASDIHLVSTTVPNSVGPSSSGFTKRHPLAIILEPSRDLAEQVYNNVVELSRHIVSPEIKTAVLVGGDQAKSQQSALERGVDIVVATLGKAEDMLKRQALDLSRVRVYRHILFTSIALLHTSNTDSFPNESFRNFI